MMRRMMMARLLAAALGTILLAAPAAAHESRTGGLPRVEFETPPDLPKQGGAEQPRAVRVTGTPRGVMGYRLPLVSRQEVPDQVVSGVLIPAHTTYVILQPGYWELIGESSAEPRTLPAAAQADEPAAPSQPSSQRWNPFRLFRQKATPTNED